MHTAIVSANRIIFKWADDVCGLQKVILLTAAPGTPIRITVTCPGGPGSPSAPGAPGAPVKPSAPYNIRCKKSIHMNN